MDRKADPDVRLMNGRSLLTRIAAVLRTRAGRTDDELLAEAKQALRSADRPERLARCSRCHQAVLKEQIRRKDPRPLAVLRAVLVDQLVQDQENWAALEPLPELRAALSATADEFRRMRPSGTDSAFEADVDQLRGDLLQDDR
jgi:hypothetical protein